MKGLLPEYDPSYAVRARDLCMLGCSEMEIANLLGISVGMLRAWREHYVEFAYAWDDGNYHASTKVVAALHKRACGYDKVIWKETKDGMMRELKHIEPSVPACMAWLTNKHPDTWSKSVQDSAPNSGNILPENMSDTEAARRVAFALAKAIYEGGRSIEHGNATDSSSGE